MHFFQEFHLENIRKCFENFRKIKSFSPLINLSRLGLKKVHKKFTSISSNKLDGREKPRIITISNYSLICLNMKSEDQPRLPTVTVCTQINFQFSTLLIKTFWECLKALAARHERLKMQLHLSVDTWWRSWSNSFALLFINIIKSHNG